MDYLWSPWRYRYVSKASPQDACLFCRVACAANDRENYVLSRAVKNFVMLNAFPYTSGHLMIAPYAHVRTLSDSDPEALAEMIALAQFAESALGRVYNAHGFNMGMNIGASAGAGVAGHIHLHLLPRWSGDVNFMTTIGETRVLPEELEVTYQRLSAEFRKKSEDPSQG